MEATQKSIWISPAILSLNRKQWKRTRTNMAYIPIEVDRKKLTIMGVPFPDPKTLEGVAHALGSNMYEDFRPTKRDIELIRDRSLGKLTSDQVLEILIEENNGQK